MRHFIAYHNTEKMGRPLHGREPLRLLTNKSVNHLLQNTVWFVTGENTGTRQYFLGSVFRVTEVGEADEDGFKRFASGPGHAFQPPIPIKEKEWFPEVLRATGNFGLGVQEVKDEAVIAGLVELAAQSGYPVVGINEQTSPTENDSRRYPERKERQLTEEEKEQIRYRIEQGQADIYQLAEEFNCSSSQIAGIKAALKR